MQDLNCLSWVFLVWNSKKLLYCGILHQHTQIFLNTKFQLEIKILKLETKIALIGFFQLEFLKDNDVSEISLLDFVNMQNFIKKQENFKFGQVFLGCNLTKTINF